MTRRLSIDRFQINEEKLGDTAKHRAVASTRMVVAVLAQAGECPLRSE